MPKRTMEKIVLFGNGSVAENHAHLLDQDNGYEVVAFSVDRPFLKEDKLMGRPVIAWDEVEQHYPPEMAQMHIAVGYVKMNKLRAARFHEAKEKGYRLISYVNPKAVTWEGLEMGENCWIGAGSLIAAGSVVIRDVPDNATVVGVPGHVARQDGEKIDILDHTHVSDPMMVHMRDLIKRVKALEDK